MLGDVKTNSIVYQGGIVDKIVKECQRKLTRGVLNGPIQFESARKIWPMLELLAKIR